MEKCESDGENCKAFVYYPNYGNVGGQKRCYFFNNLAGHSCGVSTKGAVSYFPVAPIQCTDKEDFIDSAGKDCDAYESELNACKDGIALKEKSFFKQFENSAQGTALTDCCLCGGGGEFSFRKAIVSTAPCKDKSKIVGAENPKKWSDSDLLGLFEKTVGSQLDCAQFIFDSIQKNGFSLCKEINSGNSNPNEDIVVFAMHLDSTQTIVNSKYFKWENSMGFALATSQVTELEKCDASWIGHSDGSGSVSVYMCDDESLKELSCFLPRFNFFFFQLISDFLSFFRKEKEESDDLNAGGIAGIIVGIIVFLIFCGSIIWWCKCRDGEEEDVESVPLTRPVESTPLKHLVTSTTDGDGDGEREGEVGYGEEVEMMPTSNTTHMAGDAGHFGTGDVEV